MRVSMLASAFASLRWYWIEERFVLLLDIVVNGLDVCVRASNCSIRKQAKARTYYLIQQQQQKCVFGVYSIALARSLSLSLLFILRLESYNV